MHLLVRRGVGDKCYNSAIIYTAHDISGFLGYLAPGAELGGFAGLKPAAHADPLVVIHVVFLANAVQHQVFSGLFKVNQRRFQHIVPSIPVL